LRVAQDLGDQHAIGFALANLAYLVWCQGRRRESRAMYEAAVAHVRRSGDAMFTGMLLGALGWYTMVDGDLERARRYKEEGLAILRRLDAAEAVGLALLGLAHLARREGDGARLRALLEESAPLLHDTGSPALADWLTFTGQVEVERGAHAQSVRLLAAGESDGPRAGSLRTLSYSMPRDERDACLAAARSALGEEAFAVAWAEGAAMPPDRAIACALANAPLAPAHLDRTDGER